MVGIGDRENAVHVRVLFQTLADPVQSGEKLLRIEIVPGKQADQYFIVGKLRANLPIKNGGRGVFGKIELGRIIHFQAQ